MCYEREQRRVTCKMLSTRPALRSGTWNVRSLRGLGKMEQLSGEMERYKLAVLAVTETHLTAEGEMVLDVSVGYRLISLGRWE